jgi:hypothetical protein
MKSILKRCQRTNNVIPPFLFVNKKEKSYSQEYNITEKSKRTKNQKRKKERIVERNIKMRKERSAQACPSCIK